jgi:protein-tyrosine phosphatase
MEHLWDKYRRNSKGWEKDLLAKVHPRILVGSANNVDLYTVSSNNITHIVNCAEEWVSSVWFKSEFPERIICINALDHKTEDITKWYPLFETSMNKFLSDPECKTIYVHCECGINRSGFLVLIYMCLKFGYDIETVAKSMLIQRPCMFTNPSYRLQTIEYIKKHT